LRRQHHRRQLPINRAATVRERSAGDITIN
jgi:hypothetical protein